AGGEPGRDGPCSLAWWSTRPDHAELSDEAAVRPSRRRPSAELGPPQGRSDPHLAALGGEAWAASPAPPQPRASGRYGHPRRGLRPRAGATPPIARRSQALQQALRDLYERQMRPPGAVFAAWGLGLAYTFR